MEGETQTVETTETEIAPVEAAEPVDRRAAIEAALSQQSGDRARDEQGRFAAAESAQESALETPEPPKARKYPSSWKPDFEPLYRRVEGDPELSKLLDEIDRRESDYHKGHEPLRQKAALAEEFEQAIAPFQQTLQGLGVAPAQAVQALFAADHRLRYGSPQEKRTAFDQLAQMYGVNLSEAAPASDPALDAVMREMQMLRAQQAQFYYQQQAASQQAVNSEIAEFAKGKDDFDAVREDMAALIQAGRAETLQDAYDMARWARPEIRQTLLEQQVKAAEEKRRKEAQEQATRAKAAAVQVRGAPVVGGSPLPKDRRSQIEAALSGRL